MNYTKIKFFVSRSIFAALILLATVSFLFAGGPLVWSVNSASDVLRGEALGVSVDKNGRIFPAPAVQELATAGQPFVWTAAADSQGRIYFGTGPEGRLFRVERDGRMALFADFNEINVSAIAIAASGDIFAATSPDGRVYKLDSSGKASVYFEPGEKYIWSLAVLPDGSLAVGTGTQGKIFRVRSANAKPLDSLLYDSAETHIISLAADRNGNLIAGTDPGGIILRIGSDGKAFGLIDSPLREVHEVVAAPDGSIYALVLGDSISVAKPQEAAAAIASATVSVEKPNPILPAAPRRSKYDLAGVKSAVYKIKPDGSNSLIWTSATISGFSLEVTSGGVLIGTSERGRIYSVTDSGDETLFVQTDAGQISRIIRGRQEIFAAASNPGKLYRIGPDTVASGEYRSAVLDAKGTANWGTIWWTAAGDVRIETRTGNTEKPDETWSGWTPVSAQNGRGRIPSGPARFLQWRASLSGPKSALTELNVSFLPQNIAPEITSVQILPANVALLPNPPIQIDPNIALAGLDPAIFGIVVTQQPPRRAYLRGARGFQWTAEDRNGDRLEFDIYIREAGSSEFVLLRKGQTETFFSLDGYTLADGRYVLKIVARDTPSNPEADALSSEFQTEPFDIDNTPPVITPSAPRKSAAGKIAISFTAIDKTGYIARAEYSLDGGDWQTVAPVDGIADGPEETFVVEVSQDSARSRLLTLRVFDSSGNVAATSLVVRIN